MGNVLSVGIANITSYPNDESPLSPYVGWGSLDNSVLDMLYGFAGAAPAPAYPYAPTAQEFDTYAGGTWTAASAPAFSSMPNYTITTYNFTSTDRNASVFLLHFQSSLSETAFFNEGSAGFVSGPNVTISSGAAGPDYAYISTSGRSNIVGLPKNALFTETAYSYGSYIVIMLISSTGTAQPPGANVTGSIFQAMGG